MTQQTPRFPAEWEPQSAILLAWPTADTDWAERLAEVEETYIALVQAITRFQLESTALQTAQTVFTRMQGLSLFNLLR